MKCEHKNIIVTEYGNCIRVHNRSSGSWERENYPGEYKKMIHIECHDCGLKDIFSKRSNINPAWVKQAIQEIGI